MADIQVNLQDEEWKQYKETFQKSYSDEKTEQERYKIFIKNKKMVEEHNEKFKKGETTFEMGLNHFSDKTPEEMKQFCGVRK